MLEIERKFRVVDDGWRAAVTRTRHYRQGYLASDRQASIRVRSDGTNAWLNIKASRVGRARTEFEYPVPLADAETMLGELCGTRLIEKTRHWVEHRGHEWEVDVFEGRNLGLVIAEVELSSEDEDFERPPWLGQEVTEDLHYYNDYLARYPYTTWCGDV